jgi:hypothetical protein
MNARPSVVLTEVLARLAYLGRLRTAALSLTDVATPGARLRASELAAGVSELLDVQDSPWFRRDLATALHAVGWRFVTVDGVRLWKGRVMR